MPGAYNFARRAWFDGLSATGSVVGDVELVEPPAETLVSIAVIQRRLSAHVRRNLDGTAGAIAATLASGDRPGCLGVACCQHQPYPSFRRLFLAREDPSIDPFEPRIGDRLGTRCRRPRPDQRGAR